MFKRSLYRAHAAVFRFDGWFKQRFTSAGMLLVGLLVLAGVFGVNIRANLAYELVSLATALLAVAMLSALWFRPAISIRRRLPRYASDGDPVRYVVEVENRTRRVPRGLLIQEQVESLPLAATRGDDPLVGGLTVNTVLTSALFMPRTTSRNPCTCATTRLLVRAPRPARGLTSALSRRRCPWRREA